MQRITAVEFAKKNFFLDSEGSQIEKTIIDVFL
jgi:hypothetical protein